MCLDIDIHDGTPRKTASDARMAIFRRADQVDDTQKENAADHRVVDGEAGAVATVD